MGVSGLHFDVLPAPILINLFRCREFYSETGEVVVALLPLETTTEIPSHPKFYADSDLQGVEDVTPTPVDGSSDFRYVRIAAGTTNDQFREWCLKNNKNPGNAEIWWGKTYRGHRFRKIYYAPRYMRWLLNPNNEWRSWVRKEGRSVRLLD